jgi:hypothetical protein
VEADALTIDTPDGRVPLPAVQAMLGTVMATLLDRVPDEHQLEVQREFAEKLDTLIASARPARSGEHVLSGRDAIEAVRALVAQAVEEWEQEG